VNIWLVAYDAGIGKDKREKERRKQQAMNNIS